MRRGQLGSRQEGSLGNGRRKSDSISGDWPCVEEKNYRTNGSQGNNTMAERSNVPGNEYQHVLEAPDAQYLPTERDPACE